MGNPKYRGRYRNGADYHGGMTKAAPMQGGYYTRQCKQLQQLTETSSDSMPQDTMLMNKTSGAPQSGLSVS